MALFAAVAQAGSFSRAALDLGMQSSMLSRRIDEFEAGLKIRLFNRTAQRAILTPFGVRYLEEIDYIMQQAQTINGMLDTETSEPSGVLRISFSNDLASFCVDVLLSEFLAIYPGYSFEIILTTTGSDLTVQRYDVCLLNCEPPADSTLVCRRIGLVPHHLYATHRYLATCGTPLDPAHLAKHRCLFSRESEPGAGWTLYSGTEQVRIRRMPLLASNSPALIQQLMLQGMGIGQLGEVQAAPLLRDGKIVRVLPEWELNPMPCYILTASRILPARVSVFVEFLMREWAR